MSRLGKKPIKIPKEVQLKITESLLVIKGPKGEAEYQIPRAIKIEKNKDELQLLSSRKRKEERVNFGLARATLANIVKGVSRGFKKRLELFGVGYMMLLERDNLKLTLGYSHPIIIKKPKELEVEIKKNEILIQGVDCQKVGQFAATIRDLRRAEPYKGKGFKYVNEAVRRKVGKAALKVEGEAVK